MKVKRVNLKSSSHKEKNFSLPDLISQHLKNEDYGIRSHPFMANRWGNNGNSDRIYFEDSKITADGDCSHEIKRCLLLGWKVMTHLHSLWKSREIILPTKVHIQKPMVFPVVMYECESWNIKKAKCRRIDAFELWCFRRVLRALGQKGNQTSQS